MKIKKILSVLLTICLFVNVSFAFDPYADEEVEKKSYKKLYYGIALTLLGGFLAYDGFSLEKVDVSKPSVDFLTVSHSEWVHLYEDEQGKAVYQLRSGITFNNVSGVDYDVSDYKKYEILKEGAQGFDNDHPYDVNNYEQYSVESNSLYNNGNVDLTNIEIEVRYRYEDGTYIGDKDGTHVTTEGYHTAGINEGIVIGYETVTVNGQEKQERVCIEEGDERIKSYTGITLAKGDSIDWQDVWEYKAGGSDTPRGETRTAHMDYHSQTIDGVTKWFYQDGYDGLNLGNKSPILMEVRVKLEKNKQYTPIYETRHKSDLEGVAGIFVGIAGIYFIIDHFFDMHKFNAYAKRHHLNLRVATASNQYKLMLQKKI